MAGRHRPGATPVWWKAAFVLVVCALLGVGAVAAARPHSPDGQWVAAFDGASGSAPLPPAAAPVAPESASPSPSAAASSPSAAPSVSPFRSRTPSPSRSASPRSTAPSSPKPPAVVAQYVVTATWPTGYQAMFTVSNPATVPQAWAVTLDLPPRTKVVGAWNATASGSTFTAPGSAKLPPGGVWRFVVQFSRADNGSYLPRSCTVNGQPCRS